jgi:prepilin-type processing-associated H-X9-DG protein
MDSMYGRTIGRGVDFDAEGVYITSFWNLPQTCSRAVFLDEGWMTPDSYAVYYNQQKWWDDPPIRHWRGTTFSFADGHAERWKWNDAETVRIGNERVLGHPSQKYVPTTSRARKDLYRMQITTYGRLGYTPTNPELANSIMFGS